MTVVGRVGAALVSQVMQMTFVAAWAEATLNGSGSAVRHPVDWLSPVGEEIDPALLAGHDTHANQLPLPTRRVVPQDAFRTGRRDLRRDGQHAAGPGNARRESKGQRT